MSGSSYCTVCEAYGFPEVKIYWDDNKRSAKTGKKIPLDASGNYHKHRERQEPQIDYEQEQDENQKPLVRPGSEPENPRTAPTLQGTGTAVDPTLSVGRMLGPVSVVTTQQDQRNKDIAAAHEQNMQASKAQIEASADLRSSIDNLSGEIATLTVCIGDLVNRILGKSEIGREYHQQNNEDPGN